MIVLDASVLIALFDDHDSHHTRARDLIESNVDDEFVMHHLTIAEVLVGAVRSGRGAQRQADLASIGIGTFSSPASEPLQLAELRVKTSLRLPDCCVLAVALSTSSPIATFDRSLARAATEQGISVRD